MTLTRRGEAQDEPGPDSSAAPEAERPPRPVLVEIASAVLIVDGLLSTILSLDLAGRLADQNPAIEPLAMFTIAFGLATTLLGVLLHFGHGWLLTINVAAVAGFLELTAGSPAGFVTAGFDIFVVLILLWTRPWFAWSADGDGDGDPDDPEPGESSGDSQR